MESQQKGESQLCKLAKLTANVSFFFSTESETHVHISSDVKRVCYSLEGKHFVENALECLGSSYFMRKCSV